MCGIVGYIGQPQSDREHGALDVLMEGLRRLEYRGYDSAGVAVVDGGQLYHRKKAGKLANLAEELAEHPIPTGLVGIGHTRWATHGGPTDRNAHPHVADEGRLALIHNGIIENYAELREELLAKGVEFLSETDTEVAAHLLADVYRNAAGQDLTRAMQLASQRLEGAFTLLAVHVDHPDRVVASRRNSPLVVGLGEGENFLGSDVSGFIDFTREAIELEQDQVVTITADAVEISDFRGGPADGKRFTVDWDASAAEKGGFETFMEKEIHDQPQAVQDTLLGRTDAAGALMLDELRIDPEELKAVDKIIVLACGTSAYAGTVAKYAIEHWCRIPVEVELSHEFRYRDPIIDPMTLVVTVSQSGEAADTLMAIRHAREQHAKVIAICNTNGATIPRESDAVIYTHAGPEIGVASTKGFLTQVVACYLLGLYLAQVRGMKYGDEIRGVMSELDQMPGKIQEVLDEIEPVYELARVMAKEEEAVFFLGRHVGYPVALEGALKLKEIAYMHAEGFAAGELKHGPIAVIEEGTPVFVVVPPKGRDQLHDKVVSNIQEIRARGARTIVLAERGDDDVKPYADTFVGLPACSTLLQPLVAAVPLQAFACELATAKGHDVDQPRNLAKSVTVE